MKAGLKLDRQIAEKVLGHKVVEKRWGKEKQYASYSLGEPAYYDDAGASVLWNPLPNYSTNIAAAWEVVEKLAADGWRVDTITSECGGTDCKVSCVSGARGTYCSDAMEGLELKAPHAICRAALRAVKAWPITHNQPEAEDAAETNLVSSHNTYRNALEFYADRAVYERANDYRDLRTLERCCLEARYLEFCSAKIRFRFRRTATQCQQKKAEKIDEV